MPDEPTEVIAAEPEQPDVPEPETVNFSLKAGVNEVATNVGPVDETIVIGKKGYSTSDPFIIAALDETEGVKRGKG